MKILTRIGLAAAFLLTSALSIVQSSSLAFANYCIEHFGPDIQEEEFPCSPRELPTNTIYRQSYPRSTP